MEANHSSNWRELTAVVRALFFFATQLKGKHVLVLTDNTWAVTYINKLFGTRSPWASVSSCNHVFLGGEQSGKSVCSPSEGYSKCTSRLSQSASSEAERVGPEPKDVLRLYSQVRYTRVRSLCFQEQCQGDSILLAGKGGSSLGAGRAYSPIAVCTEVCLSSYKSHPDSYPEVPLGTTKSF